MLSTLLAVAVLAAADPDSRPALADDDLATYRAASAGVGRDPDAHVRLALWCEAHGLQVERLKHLAIAVLTDPRHATARACWAWSPIAAAGSARTPSARR